jgi:6-pyruvoyltetrahydropterin/6-carboxytetrahydropterin synthase
VTLRGDIVRDEQSPEDGMVMDFGEVKTIAKRLVVDAWDHAFLVWKNDKQIVDFLATIADHKTVLMDTVPTAENLAACAFKILAPAYLDAYGRRVRLERVRLYETPNCWADALANSAN